MRKSLWEKLNKMLDSSLDMDAVVFVVVDWVSVVSWKFFVICCEKLENIRCFSRS